jgi:hypothetical protein
MFVSVYRTITVFVQPVWPIVLYVKILLHFRLQCRTYTLHLSNQVICMQRSYFRIHSSLTETRYSEIFPGNKFSQ